MQRTWGEEYRTTMVCIDSYKDGVPTGRLYNPHKSQGSSFRSLTQLLQEMEKTLDDMDFPKAYTVTRAFAAQPERSSGPPGSGPGLGSEGTFAVKVLFRQNASWQGSVTWLEGKREQSFRSVLELILLLDSAMTCREAS